MNLAERLAYRAAAPFRALMTPDVKGQQRFAVIRNASRPELVALSRPPFVPAAA